jgi:hypothetical protein
MVYFQELGSPWLERMLLESLNAQGPSNFLRYFIKNMWSFMNASDAPLKIFLQI